MEHFKQYEKDLNENLKPSSPLETFTEKGSIPR